MIPLHNTAPAFTSLTRLLASGDGLIYFDHQDVEIGYADILAAARACGREHDVLVLDFPTRKPSQPSPIKSNTFNPFAHADAEGVRMLLVSQIEAAQLPGSNGHGVFEARVIHLVEILSPVLVWLRDAQRVPLDAEMVSHCLQYLTLAKMAFGATFTHPNQGVRLIEGLNDVVKTLLGPIRSYFLEIGGYDPSTCPDSQRSLEPARQHCYVTMYLSALSHVAGRFADIFHSETPDVDMDDVLTNARVLVVRMPTLKGSSYVHEPVTALLMASLHLAMSARVAGRTEPSRTPIMPASKQGISARQVSVVLGEADARTAPNSDVMAALGRSAGVRFCSGLLEATNQPTGLQGLLSVLSSLRPARLLRPRGAPLKPPITAAARPQAPSRPSSENAA